MTRLALRAADLVEKAFMPWDQAEKLALDEIGIGDDEIDELIGEATSHAIIGLLDDEEVREFVRSILVHQPDGATESKALLDVATERHWQDAKWGGPTHDDGHNQMDWYGFVHRRLETLLLAVFRRNNSALRKTWIEIAALAVAAVESIDRKGSIATQSEAANGGSPI